MEKPIVDLASFQQTILGTLPDEIKPVGFVPRLAGPCVKPDAQAMKDDLDYIDALLKDCFANNDMVLLSYAAQFLSSLGCDAGSKRIVEASVKLRNLAKGDVPVRDAVKQELQIIRTVVNGRMARSERVYDASP